MLARTRSALAVPRGRPVCANVRFDRGIYLRDDNIGLHFVVPGS